MKTKTLFFFCFFIGTLSAISQSLTIGAKGTLTNCNKRGVYEFENFINNKSRKVSVFDYGLFASYKISERGEIQIELSKSTKGFDYNSEFHLIDNRYIGCGGYYIGDYWQVPVIYKYKYGKIIKLTCFSGIYVAGLMKTEINNTVAKFVLPDFTFEDYTDLVNDNFNKFDAGGLFGVGIEVPVYKSIYVLTEMQYCFGMLKLLKDKVVEYQAEDISIPLINHQKNIYSSTMMYSLGVLYRFPQK